MRCLVLVGADVAEGQEVALLGRTEVLDLLPVDVTHHGSLHPWIYLINIDHLAIRS